MRKPTTRTAHGWQVDDTYKCHLFDSFSHGRMPLDLTTDEFLEVGFAFDVELAANPGELVCPRFCHLQDKQLYFAAIDHHSESSSALNLSWEARHSIGKVDDETFTSLLNSALINFVRTTFPIIQGDVFQFGFCECLHVICPFS